MKHGDSRKALFVGINHYAQYPLKGCENDAQAMHDCLLKHEKRDPNFDCLLRLDAERKVTGPKLKEYIVALLQEDVNLALFYFSGHGTTDPSGLSLVCSDYPAPESKVSMAWVMEQVMQSTTKVKEFVMILDCCHAGGAADLPGFDFPLAQLPKGVTILAATSAEGSAAERGFHGKFTQLLERGLKGAAKDMVGHVTTASLFAFADSFLSLWEQQPVFKTHVAGLTALRYCIPSVPKIELRMVTDIFTDPAAIFPLDHSYLRESGASRAQIRLLRALQRLRRHGYLEGVHGYTIQREARIGGGCQLTDAGKDLYAFVSRNKI